MLPQVKFWFPQVILEKVPLYYCRPVPQGLVSPKSVPPSAKTQKEGTIPSKTVGKIERDWSPHIPKQKVIREGPVPSFLEGLRV